MLDFPISNIGTLPGLELQIIQDKILLFFTTRLQAFGDLLSILEATIKLYDVLD